MVCSDIREAASFKIGHMSNTVEDLLVLRRLHINGLQRKSPLLISVTWLKPPVGWVKINTDGAAHGAPGMAGARGIFRIHDGSAIASFVVPLGTCYAFETEISVIIFALNKVVDVPCANFWLECDSALVVHLHHHRSVAVPWHLRREWEVCLCIMDKLNVHVSHIYREGNKVTDRLSVMGIGLQEIQWWDSYPKEAHDAMIHDAMGRESFRLC